MRIIAGRAKGRTLFAPKGKTTRPTLDRVREALFSILGEAVEGTSVLDLFAGTGALGLEALSRGAVHATFVEEDRRVAAVLQRNITSVGGDTRVLLKPLPRALANLAGNKFHLVFLDPPYDKNLLPSCLEGLLHNDLLHGAAILVCE